MEPEDAKFMRTYVMSLLIISWSFLFIEVQNFRERRPGSIDVDPNFDAIVLSYEIDVQILGPMENTIHSEKKVFNVM